MGHLILIFLVVAPLMNVPPSHGGTVRNSYTLKVSRDGKNYFERIDVDTRKRTGTSKLREASSGRDAGETIYDFNRHMTMTRIPEAKACFLSQSVENIPRMADLLQLLKVLSQYASVEMTSSADVSYKVVGKLHDRSRLSKEMVELCAKLPIYRIGLGDQLSHTEDTDFPEGRKQRRGICHAVLCIRIVCSPRCGWRGCSMNCRRACDRLC